MLTKQFKENKHCYFHETLCKGNDCEHLNSKSMISLKFKSLYNMVNVSTLKKLMKSLL
jgi:hypothetical protein